MDSVTSPTSNLASTRTMYRRIFSMSTVFLNNDIISYNGITFGNHHGRPIKGEPCQTNAADPLFLRFSGVIRRSASRLRFRFGQVKLNNHSSFGVRRLVAAMAPASKGKRRQVAALHSALLIGPSFARILTPLLNCTL